MPLTARQRSIHNKNGAKRATSFTKGKRKLSEGDYLVTNAPTDLRSIAYPGGAAALGLLLTARIISAYWGHIADCDETYNYWEPLHYLVYGSGLQTWEYSPIFAIRSYAPLWLFAAPAKILAYFMSPVSVFYTLRVLLATFTACAELMFYKAVCHEFGVHVGRVWLALTLPAAGMFACSAAMLPSAWSGALASGALACWWRRRYAPAILLTAASALLSWPFTALLGVPIAIDMLIIKRQFLDFIKWSLISLIVILVPAVLVDSWHYGRLVVAPWNILVYNVLTEHGPNLYGVEPWTYYFVNGFLNFNIVWVYALSCPVLLMTCAAISPRSTARASFCAPYWLSLLPLALWLAVFMLQPHKEERFLYPIYSMIVLGGAIAVDCLQKMLYATYTQLIWHRMDKRHFLLHTGHVAITCVLFTGVVGLSRIGALYMNYNGPMTILRHVPTAPENTELTVCFGKEWYRSPSSFLLPPHHHVRFIQSDFDGQMPAPFATTHNGSYYRRSEDPALWLKFALKETAGDENNKPWNIDEFNLKWRSYSTRLIHPHFNDLNKGDNRTYLTPSQCHYLVDSDIGKPTALQPAYHKDSSWEIISTVPLIDANKSHRVFRAFYVPVLSSRYNVYGNLYLLKNKQFA